MKREEAQAHLVIRCLFETPIVDTMSFSQAAPFESGARSIQWLVTVVLVPGYVLETIRPGENRVDMLGVVRPVGSNIERATRGKTIRN